MMANDRYGPIGSYRSTEAGKRAATRHVQHLLGWQRSHQLTLYTQWLDHLRTARPKRPES